MRHALFILLLLSPLVVGGPANAAPPRTTNDKVEWMDDQWPRVTAWEAGGTLAATVTTIVIERRWPPPSDARVDLAVPIIDTFPRFLLRGRSAKVQRVFGEWSDLGFRMMAFYPYVMDVGVAALGLHRNLDVAGQLALIDLQALTLSGFTHLIATRVAARRRPYTQDCNSDTKKVYDHECGGDNDNRSFYSGHAAAAFTSAGLTCLHHQNLPLFGGGPVETWACVWALSVATLSGVGRIVEDSHYASDVLIGAGIGWFYGYVMPKFLHFKDGKLAPPKERKAGELIWMPSFAPTNGGGVLSVSAAL